MALRKTYESIEEKLVYIHHFPHYCGTCGPYIHHESTTDPNVSCYTQRTSGSTESFITGVYVNILYCNSHRNTDRNTGANADRYPNRNARTDTDGDTDINRRL